MQPWAFPKRRPCDGMYMTASPDGAIKCIHLHYQADTSLINDPEKLSGLRAKMTPAKWNQEMEGDAHALSGARVYPSFNRSIHVLPHEEVIYADPVRKIPRRGCRYMSIDPHPRTPHAMLWVLIDHWNDWYIYRDLWPSITWGTADKVSDYTAENEFSVKDYCEYAARVEGNQFHLHNPNRGDEEWGEIISIPGAERIIDRYMDYAGKGFNASGEDSAAKESYAKRYERYGIQCSKPNKEHAAGEDAIRTMLEVRYHDALQRQWPVLHISSQCEELIFELENYRYEQTRLHLLDIHDLKQRGVSARSHQIDNLRYLATAGLRYFPSMES